MHLRPAAQLEAKTEIVRESLRRIGRLDAATVDRLVGAGAAVDQFGYRTTIRVVGGPDGRLGYREQGTNRVVEVSSCPIADSTLSRLLPSIGADPGAEVTLRTSVATGAVCTSSTRFSTFRATLPLRSTLIGRPASGTRRPFSTLARGFKTATSR